MIFACVEKKTERRKSNFRIILVILLCIASIFFFTLLASWKLLSVSRYEYSSNKLQHEFTIVQLSDLHNSEFGNDNSRLLKKIEQESPDIILMTGDMLNSDEERTDVVTNLVRKASRIAPVFYSMGNHEIEYMDNFGSDTLKQQLEEAGAIVLDGEYTDTEIAGQQVRIGGVYGYVLGPEQREGSEQQFMEDFQDTDRFKILLSHIPEGLLLWKSMEHWDVDLIFSGHVHGGQIRLPFVGGLFDPEEGFFPTYTKGMFQCGNGTMILSAGLGNSGSIPRINNLPDLVVCKAGVEASK